MRVGVFGAAGRMGSTVCAAVRDDPELELVAAIDPRFTGGADGLGVPASDDPELLVREDAEVVVDFTEPGAAAANIRFCLERGIHCVVGTTGLDEAELEGIRSKAAGGAANVFVAPNFSIGAVLLMQFAKQAARYLGSCEIVELHHNAKLDAPSGTALKTAREIAEVWQAHGRPPGGEPAPAEEEKVPGARGADVDGVHVHAVRLQGLVAHQEAVFGGVGQALTIRHDSLDRSSFMPGVLTAVKAVAGRPGLTVGLEHLLGV